MNASQVEILYFDGCPNWEGARGLVEEVAREAGVAAEVVLVRVADPGQAERLRFLGSPTIRVNGRDVEPGAEARSDYALACRVYRGPEGASGLPAPALIREALTASV